MKANAPARNIKKPAFSTSGKALIVTLIFRLLFGGYLVIQDYYVYNDAGSALTVLGIYVVLGIFTALFIFGKRAGLHGVIWLSTALIIFHTVFIVVSFGQADAGLHSPTSNLWAAILRYPFYLLTLIFTLKVFRERSRSRESWG